MKKDRNPIEIDENRLQEINAFLQDPDNELISRLNQIIASFGGAEAINLKAQEAREPESIRSRLAEIHSPYLQDLDWLIEQREKGAFIGLDAYRETVLDGAKLTFNERNIVTLEISALQFFPWLITQARSAIERQELMPGRYIRVRSMAEQIADRGDTLAISAAMQILGATYVETLDTRGTDGSNVHLGGPETITGYFGGVGQPNDYPFRWIQEYLRYYTEYGITQVLNINPGTVLAAYLLHKLGINNEFKISVFMGNDNPFSVLWTLMTARLLSRSDGTTSLIGFNFSNSVNNDTIRTCHRIREALGLTATVRFEHHITETYKSIVRQPYDRLQELIDLAQEVPNISAKHEGGYPDVEAQREHPSDILDYFLKLEEIEERGLMPLMEQNYLDKHKAVNRTARSLTQAGIAVLCAPRLHGLA